MGLCKRWAYRSPPQSRFQELLGCETATPEAASPPTLPCPSILGRGIIMYISITMSRSPERREDDSRADSGSKAQLTGIQRPHLQTLEHFHAGAELTNERAPGYRRSLEAGLSGHDLSILPPRFTRQQVRVRQFRCPVLTTGPRELRPTTTPKPSSRQQPDTRKRAGHADKTIPAAGTTTAGFRGLLRPPT